MRRLCGLIVLTILGTTGISNAEHGTVRTIRTVSTKSVTPSLKAGDKALNLRLAIDSDTTSDESEANDAQKNQRTNATPGRSHHDSTTASRPRTLKPLKRKVLVFKATWCGACQSLSHEWPSLKKAGWRVGNKLTDHIQLVDADQRADLMARYGVTSLPTLVLVDGTEELARQGLLSARNIAEFYYGRLK